MNKTTQQNAPPQTPTTATLDQVLAAVQNIPEAIKGTARWAIQKECNPPDGAIYKLLLRLLADDGPLYHSDGLYHRLQDTISEELGKVGLHPPPKP